MTIIVDLILIIASQSILIIIKRVFLITYTRLQLDVQIIGKSAVLMNIKI